MNMYFLLMINKKNPNDSNIVAMSEDKNKLIICLPPKIRSWIKFIPDVKFAKKLYEDENHIWRIQKKYIEKKW